MRRFAIYLASIAAAAAIASSVTAAEPALPESFVRDCQFYLGAWATESQADGQTIHGQWTARWSPDRTCLLSQWIAERPEGTRKGTRVHGWDAEHRQVLVVDFASDGSSSVERYSPINDKVSEGTMREIAADGTVTEATARAVIKNDDFFVWTVTRDGKATEYRFRRIKGGKETSQ